MANRDLVPWIVLGGIATALGVASILRQRPTVEIIRPATDIEASFGAIIFFEAEAFDPEGNDISDEIMWSVSLNDGPFNPWSGPASTTQITPNDPFLIVMRATARVGRWSAHADRLVDARFSQLPQ